MTDEKKKRIGKKRLKKKARVASETDSVASAPKGMDPARRNLLMGLAAGVVVGAGGGFFGGKYYGEKTRGPRRKKPPLTPAHVKIATWSARKGPNPAKVTVVEFTDFQ